MFRLAFQKTWTRKIKRVDTYSPDMDAAQLHEEYDAYKRENLRAVKEGRGKWSEELASNSESAVGLPFFLSFFLAQGEMG